jgi:hypothetical protein
LKRIAVGMPCGRRDSIRSRTTANTTRIRDRFSAPTQHRAAATS